MMDLIFSLFFFFLQAPCGDISDPVAHVEVNFTVIFTFKCSLSETFSIMLLTGERNQKIKTLSMCL